MAHGNPEALNDSATRFAKDHLISSLKDSLWRQFGASIDMLANAITAWPDEAWHTDRRFFYMAYHVSVFLDYYLTLPPKGFSPQLKYIRVKEEEIPADAMDDLVPARDYTKEEILHYIQTSREKCRSFINGLTDESMLARWEEVDSDRNYSAFEILLYNMRHVQHHAAQLNLLLRQRTHAAPDWVSKARD